MRPVLPAVLRATLLSFLLFSSVAILYATAMNERTVESLADLSLESTALALSSATESALRAGGGGTDSDVQGILSDRVVAYALIAERDGAIRFHTNPRMTGTRLAEPPGAWLRTGQPSGRRVVLGTGLPAYEYDYILHPVNGDPELLRIVLHTTPADRILEGTRRMRWTVATVLLLLWTVGIALERMVSRQFRLQAETERRERLALIGQMTATLAHEIRNALGSVKGYTQWVSEKVDPTDPRKAGLESALRAVGRIESLVNELLLFSRQETYATSSVPLLDMVRDTVAAESSGWAGKVEISVEQDACAFADPEKLARVLRNAVRNAIEAMGPQGTLKVEGRMEGKWAEIRVEDTGPGVPGADLPKMFTPFHTTKADGTGLGLAYSKKVIEGMRGRIGIRNRDEGGGVVLWVRLPGKE
jgi:signal transduction histidine kinase